MKHAAVVVLTFSALCAPAFAQDDPAKKPDPTPPAPADGAKKPEAKPAAKKERKVDDAATKALERFASLVNYPATLGFKTVSCKGDFEQAGMTIGVNPKWNLDHGFDFDVTLPDDAIEMAKQKGATEEQAKDKAKIGLARLLNFAGANATFEAPGKNWVHFDVSSKQAGDDQSVELAAFDDDADAESHTYVFGKDGLLKTSSTTLKADDPMSAQLGGMPVDVEWKFEKKGDRQVMTGHTLTIGGVPLETNFTYFEGPNKSFLLKDFTFSTPQGEMTVKFHDYTVDGKFVDSTKAEAAKPAEKKEVKAAKAEDKPADKPADNPPVPVPPAPKEDGK